MSTTAALPQLYSFGHELEMSDDKVGLLRDSSDAADDVEELRRRVENDGYLLHEGYLDRDEVLAARASLTDRLAAAGVLDPAYPAIDGVCRPGSGYVFKPEITNGNEAIQRLLYGGRIPDFYRKLLRRRNPALRLYLAPGDRSWQRNESALRPSLHGPRHASAHDVLGAIR